MSIRTAAEAKAELQRIGVSAVGWSRANNLNPGIVAQLLSGKVKGIRGEAHRAAVLLGLKDGEAAKASDLKGPLFAPGDGASK